MEAIEVEEEFQVPPETVEDNVVLLPTQTVVLPEIVPALGSGFTVMVVVVKQPVGKVYVTVTVPADTPVNTPVVEAIDAVDVDEELQVPPPAELVSVIVEPTQTDVGPPILPGNGLTVTIAVSVQPLVDV